MKRDVYTEVTDQVIRMLEKGVAPWRRPWTIAGLLPTNFRSKKVYRGINLLVLSMIGHSSPFWVTFNQTKDLGGRIRAGEKGTTVVFWKFLRAFERGESGEVLVDRVPLMRHYTVFNLDQTEGIDVPNQDDNAATFNPIEAVEKIVDEMPNPPEIRHGGARASYDSRGDIVTMPPRSAFASSSAYYSTLLHEIGHATGSVKRLARPTIVSGGDFGDCDYSQEELVAEFASAFVCAHAGIANEIEQSAAYLQGWLSVLRDDKKMLVQATGLAQRAADYILNVRFDETENSEPIRPADDLAIAA
jgi:antirestriction protein ArdC